MHDVSKVWKQLNEKRIAAKKNVMTKYFCDETFTLKYNLNTLDSTIVCLKQQFYFSLFEV